MYPTGNENDILYTITGQWTKSFEIYEGSSKHGKLIETYDEQATPTTPLIIAPLEEQDPLESRRAWANVAAGIAKGDMEYTGVEKSKIENEQRALRQQEQAEGRTWERRYFSQVESDPLLEKLGPIIGLSADEDKTGGIWRFDEEKAKAVRGGIAGGAQAAELK